MVSRSMLYMMRSLLSSSEHEVKLAKLEKQMSALDSATPGRISGRHVCLSDCFAVAASLLPQGQKLSVDARKECMRAHSDAYMQLDQARRSGYSQRVCKSDTGPCRTKPTWCSSGQKQSSLLEIRGECLRAKCRRLIAASWRPCLQVVILAGPWCRLFGRHRGRLHQARTSASGRP